MAYPLRSLLAVQGAVEIVVGLELAKIGQHAPPIPTVETFRPPRVIVHRSTPVGDLTVDARTTPDHPGLFITRHGRAAGVVMGHRVRIYLEVGPQVLLIEVGEPREAVEDIGGFGAGRIVGARLDKKDLIGAFRRKPIGENAPGAAAADDHMVVMHTRIPP